MRNRHVAVLLCSLGLVLGASRAPGEQKPVAVKTSLEALPQRVLPGVTSMFRATVRNTGRRDVIVHNGAVLEVAEGEGPFFQLKWEGELTSGPFDAEVVGPFRIRGGETRRFFFGSSLDWYENYWLADHRLCQPGAYRLRMKLDVALAPAVIGSDPEADSSVFSELQTTEVTSEEMPLVIEEPKGADREAWDFLQQEGGGGWCATQWHWVKQSTVTTLLERWPESRYAPYAALKVSSNREGMSQEQQWAACAEVSERFLQKYAESPVGALFAFRVAGCRGHQARMVATRDLAEATKLTSAAESALGRRFGPLPDFWQDKLELERNGVPTHEDLARVYTHAMAAPSH